MKLSDILKDKEKDYEVGSCQKCGHIVARYSMKIVEKGRYLHANGEVNGGHKYYYCSICKPPYDFVIFLKGELFSSDRYYKKIAPYIQINEDGTEIKNTNKGSVNK